jgi:hypothetical protein
MPQLDSVQDANRYLVDGHHQGGILPSRGADVDRNVFLMAGADVAGGVLGGDVAITGPAAVRAGVYARGELNLDAGDGWIELSSCVAARRSVACASAGDGMVVIAGDVSAPVVNLRNTIVFGNVFGDRIILRDTVVLGTVHARSSVSMQNALVATFTAERIDRAANVKLILPIAYSADEPPAGAELWCLLFDDLSHLALEPRPVVGHRITSADVHTMWYNDPDGAGRRALCVITLAPRIVNLAPVQNAVRNNSLFIRALVTRQLIHPSKSPPKIPTRDISSRLIAVARSRPVDANSKPAV